MIYILEDDMQIRAMEEYALKAAGFEVCGFENGDDFLRKCAQTPPRRTLPAPCPRSVSPISL